MDRECRTNGGKIIWDVGDRLCGLAVRVPGYRSRGPDLNSRCYQIF
jgi:hypothetical protein